MWPGSAAGAGWAGSRAPPRSPGRHGRDPGDRHGRRRSQRRSLGTRGLGDARAILHVLRRASFWAITASGTRPVSISSAVGTARAFPTCPSAPSALGRRRPSRANRYHSVSALSGSLRVRDVAQHHVGHVAGTSARTSQHCPPIAACAADRSRRRLAGCGWRARRWRVLWCRPQPAPPADDAERALGAHEQVS